MTYFSLPWFKARVAGLLIKLALVGVGLTLSSSAAAGRSDIVVALDDETAFVFLEVDGFSSDTRLLRGTVSIQTDDPMCVASSSNPCSYVINYVRIEYSSFTQPTTEGDFISNDPFVVVQGPIPVVDTGSGLVIPDQHRVEGGSDLVSEEGIVPPGFRRGLSRITSPLSINLDVPNQAFSIEGSFSSTFQGHAGTGTIVASGRQPFVNLPPIADAGPDVTLACGSNLTLDASGSTDPNDSLALFRWSLPNGDPLVTTSAAGGSSLTIPFTASPSGGTVEVLLEVFDRFGARDTDSMLVTSVGGEPRFTFVPGPLTTTSCGALNIGQAQAIDPCGQTVTISNDAPASFRAGVTLVTWTATSSSGQTATATQRVEVQLGDNPACCPAGYNVFVGTSNNDNLVGGAGNDCIIGRGAQDTINGGGGDDLISGGDGDDVINSGAGNDVVYGGSGQDQLTGGSGIDDLNGGDGNDTLRGGTGNDTLRGGQGQDQLFGEDNDDVLIGNDGDDTLSGGSGNDHLIGSGLHDSCSGGTGSNTFTSCERRPDAPSAPDSCTDGVLDGLETGVDCGGEACLACGVGFDCDDGADCASNVCSAAGACQPLGTSGSPLQAGLSISTDWGSGYCATLSVTNPTALSVNNWSVLIDTNQSVTYTTWNGTFSATSGTVTISPAFDWNRALAPNETDSSIGFCANRHVAGSGALPFVLSTAIN